MRKGLIIGSLTFTAIILSVYFQSCKRDSSADAIATKDDATSYSYTKDTLIAPLTDAIIVGENVNKSNAVLKTVDKTTLKAARYLGKRKIKDNMTIYDNDKRNPDFYVINYEGGGYAIISADKRVIPVVGFGDYGHFNIDSIPFGLQK